MVTTRDIVTNGRTADPMVEIGATGLKRWASVGTIQEEYDVNLQGVKGQRIYQEMSESDATVGGVLFAIEMAIRDIEWTVEPGGETDADKATAAFVESCREDMSHTWNDLVSEILSMLTFGWSAFEVVMKKRRGLEADPASQYDDGAIGWRKIAPRSQDSFSRWIWDAAGGVQALEQLPPPDYQYRIIPVEKLLLFATRRRKGNPEGRSVLRTAFKSWYFRKNLEVLEAIALERQGAGYPVWTLPQGASTGSGTDTDESRVNKLLKNLRLDQQAGVIEPFGHKFRFEAPANAKLEAFGEAIQRHKKDIATSVLAEFILLGMDKVGSFALVKGKKDFFQLALGGWVDSIAETFNRYAIPRLLALNPQLMRGLTALPRLSYTEPGTADLAAIGDFLQKAATSGLLTPDEGLEDWLRTVARIPARVKPPEQQPVPAEAESVSAGTVAGRGELWDPARNRSTPAAAVREAETYAEPELEAEPDDRRGRDLHTEATNAYQRDLVKLYDDWGDKTIGALQRGVRDGVGAEHLQRILDGRMEDLGVSMKALGRTRLFEAFRLGLGKDREPTPMELTKVSRKTEENDQYILESFVPDVRRKVERLILDELLGDDTATRDAFNALRSRPAQYAGAYWNTIIEATGIRRQEREKAAEAGGGKARRIRWRLDPLAHHCLPGPGTHGCIELGGKAWASWDDLPTLPAGNVTCHHNCRCSLDEEQPDGSWKRLA